MEVKVNLFALIACLIIIHTILIHLLNWSFRKESNGGYDFPGFSIILNVVEFSILFFILDCVI